MFENNGAIVLVIDFRRNRIALFEFSSCHPVTFESKASDVKLLFSALTIWMMHNGGGFAARSIDNE